MIGEHEARLVLAWVRGRFDEADLLQARHRPSPEAVVRACRACDVHPWVHALLDRAGRLDALPQETRSRLEQLRTKVRHDNLLLLGRAEQALGALRDAGVVPVALKGLDFLSRLYERFDERATDDIDLLVRHEDLEPALGALERAGWHPPAEPRRTHYIRSSHHLPLASSGPVPVDLELHWNLAQQERYRIDPAALHERAVELDVGGVRVRRLGDVDIVAHLLVHHFSHYFDPRLKWAVDLERLSRAAPIDWDAVARRIEAWGGGAAAGISLVHLRKLRPELIPSEALERLPVAWWRRALVAPLRSRHPLELFRHTGRRRVQLYLAGVMLERPSGLPGWLLHRATRDRRTTSHPLDPDADPRPGCRDDAAAGVPARTAREEPR